MKERENENTEEDFPVPIRVSDSYPNGSALIWDAGSGSRCTIILKLKKNIFIFVQISFDIFSHKMNKNFKKIVGIRVGEQN